MRAHRIVPIALLSLLATACRASPGAAPTTGAATTGAASGATTTATASASSPVAAAECAPARPARPSHRPREFEFGGVAREYLLALPRGYDGVRRHPLLLNFHGFSGSKERHEANTGLGAAGSARGYVVVTPDALGEPREWNIFGAAGAADDYAFVDALVAHLTRALCIDRHRVYAAGHSNGSAFAGFLACRRPFRFAAVAMVSAAVPAGCPDGVAPAVVAIHGTADPQVPYRGGTVGGSTVAVPPVRDVVAGYAERYGCDLPGEQGRAAPGVRRLRSRGCAGGSEVLLYTVVGGGHEWPGGATARGVPAADRVPGSTFPASERILDFFDRHPSA